MADDEPVEYTCPECGSAFAEGAESCPVCGTAFDWAEETDYVCPECGARVPLDSKSCPECGAQFVADVGGPDKGIDAMLEAAVAETIVTPKREEPPSEWEEAAPGAPAKIEGPQSIEAPKSEADGTAPEPTVAAEERAPPAQDKAAEAAAPAHVEEEGPAQGARGPEATFRPGAHASRRYAGGFSWVGLLFVILAGIALALTVVALRWDAISSGSRYETIGAMQSMVIVVGIAAFVICAFVSMWDLLRGPRPAER